MHVYIYKLNMVINVLNSYSSSTTSFLVVVKYPHGSAAIWKEMARTCRMMISSARQLKWMYMKPLFRRKTKNFLVMVRP